uniref:DAZ-associated protein 1 n=2 Tax=Cajanus cajan TaxID=3821 RepID=A0A151TZQ9_CAJCA|nr:DAZ-associated protein 1 [Cajanus cajan]
MIRRRKIFVGGLPSGISEEKFKEYFERFGTITDVAVMRDSVTNRPRGFGFITFGSEKSVNDVMVNSFYDLNGKQVEVKRVMPKVENRDRGVFDQLKYNNGNGTSWEGFPYYGNNMIPSPAYGSHPWYNNNAYGSHPWYNNNAYGSHPWYNNNGLYANAPNPYDWYPMLGASLPRYMPMAPMAQPCPDPFGYCFPSYPYVGGNVGVNNKPTQNNHRE